MGRKTFFVAIAVLGASLPGLAQARGASVETRPAAAVPTGLVGGSAYGYYSLIKQGSTTARNGPIALAITGCNGASHVQRASTGSIQYQNYAQTGTVTNTVATVRRPGSLSITSTSTIQGLNLFGGLVKATTISATSTTTGFAKKASSSVKLQFNNLIVNGTPVKGTIAANTREAVPGIGYVVLNEQKGRLKGKNSTHASVDFLDLQVTKNNSYGLLPGSEIIIGHADSRFARTKAEFAVNASSFGYQYRANDAASTASSGRAALASIGCTGGAASNRVNAVTSAAGTTGTIVDHASGGTVHHGAKAHAESTVQGANLLSGLVHAQEIDSVVNVRRSNGIATQSGASVFSRASIAGVPLANSPSANSRVTITGVGYAILNQIVRTKTKTYVSESVNGIHIYVDKKNTLGLPVGSQIIVAHATAGVANAK